MPFIIKKRSDVPNSTLQFLDLWPNTSQRKVPYTREGQTKYGINGVSETLAMTNAAGVITVDDETDGLAAYLVTNVDDGALAAAQGFMSFLAPLPPPAPGVITCGGIPFDALPIPRVPGQNGFNVAAGPTVAATEFAAALIDPLIPTSALVIAAYIGPGPVSPDDVLVDALVPGSAGDLIGLTSVIPAPGPGFFILVPWGGGADSQAMSAAQANTSVADIRANLLRLNDLDNPALDMDLAALNGEMAAGALVAGQLTDVLQILAGREYRCPAGVQVEAAGVFAVLPAVGAAGGPGFTDTPFKHTYETGSLRLSVAEGKLSLMINDGFEYGGLTGTNTEGVVVLDDDGTIFVP